MSWTTQESGFHPGKGNRLFSKALRPVLGPTRLPIQGMLWVKRMQLETDHSPPPRDEVTNTRTVHLHSRIVFRRDS